ncbi:type II secretion system protein [Anatilimnocola floriformis]|uniref:type II secretion system protein n=1 Tax=Anatilimnocola floriformis TaxID=2948575 RepID=UPI0020C21AE1|nr:prepilin-type N-terminal cleavage/methylation domain-containing protein [Anatilimnocola floriformis]
MRNSLRLARIVSGRTRRGLTLIELVVVLLVLAALAGMLVPVVQNMVQKSHGSAGATNIGEIAKAIGLFESQTGRHPDNFDALYDGTNLVITAGSGLTAAAIDDDDLESLNTIGIKAYMVHDPATTNKTFEPYALTAVPTVLASGSQVAILSAANVQALGLQPTVLRTATTEPASSPVKYIAFGVGQRTTTIGKTMLDAPVHFPEAGENPLTTYSRFLAIYAIPRVGPARLASVAAAHDDGLSGVGGHIAEYFETQN